MFCSKIVINIIRHKSCIRNPYFNHSKFKTEFAYSINTLNNTPVTYLYGFINFHRKLLCIPTINAMHSINSVTYFNPYKILSKIHVSLVYSLDFIDHH